jgi:hypothetical protein
MDAWGCDIGVTKKALLKIHDDGGGKKQSLHLYKGFVSLV